MLAIASIACIAGSSLAQQPAGGFQAVDQGYADVGPLRVSSFSLPADLRSASGFDTVYRVPGAGSGVRGIGNSNQFARISGGLTAVFPRSEYVATKDGTLVILPPGTVFYIGSVPEHALGAHANTPSPTLISRAASTRVSGLAGADQNVGLVDLRVHNDAGDPNGFVKIQTRPDPTPPPNNVLVNDTYRRQRLRAMLMAAVRAGEGGE
jgi:hypothetical protein